MKKCVVLYNKYSGTNIQKPSRPTMSASVVDLFFINSLEEKIYGRIITKGTTSEDNLKWEKTIDLRGREQKPVLCAIYGTIIYETVCFKIQLFCNFRPQIFPFCKGSFLSFRKQSLHVESFQYITRLHHQLSS